MKIQQSLFLSIIALLFISTTSIAVASTSEFEFSVSPGESLTKQIRFDNTGLETAHSVWATEYGTAMSWTTQTSSYFGDVAPGESSYTRTINIHVPQNVKPGESYDLWYSFAADEGDTGAKIHIILTIKSPNNGGNDLLRSLQENWIWILTAAGVISAVTVVALTKKKGRKPSDDELSVPHSPSSPTETPVEVSEQEIPPPPDFSPDMPPPQPRPYGDKSAAEKHLEKVEDKIAEESRLRRGLTFDKEQQKLLDERPAVLRKYDATVDPSTIPLGDPRPPDPYGDDREYNPPLEYPQTYEEAVNIAKDMGTATSIPIADFGKLSEAELEAYNKWRRSYSSFLRRYRGLNYRNKGPDPIGYATGARG